ncbi:hypothetical protein GCM10027161_71700 [Microbispora hainanensis]
MVRVESKSPSIVVPPAWTVTSSSSPSEAVTTTVLSGRTFALPVAGLIVIFGAGMAGAASPESPPAEPGVLDPPEHADREAASITASPAIGHLERLPVLSTTTPP